MQKLLVSSINIELIRKHIKHMHLAVYPPHGNVRISVPAKANTDMVRLFIVSKIAWIKRQQKKFKAQVRLSQREYVSRESHYFQGKRYLLNVIEREAAPEIKIRNNAFIDLYIRNGTNRKQREIILNEWYRKQIKGYIPALIKKWEEKMGVKVASWGVKLMKTRWGTCNTKVGRIWLNLELAKKPAECLDYLVLHEMLHLKERRHNERFMGMLDKYMPNWKVIKSELNKYPLREENWEY